MPSEAERQLIERLNAFVKAPSAPDVMEVSSDELESISIERLAPVKKGSWWLLPKKVAEDEGREEA